MAEPSDPSLGESQPALPPTPQTVGSFRVDGTLGTGGMGVVYRVLDPRFDRELALKVSLAEPGSLHEQRFLAEARVIARLQHPSITPIYDLGHEDGRWYYTMKRVRGRTLADAMRASAPGGRERLGRRRLIAIIVNVCQAVAYAHARGVIHRDLKPQNIMLGDFGEVYVMDWGLAKAIRADGLAPLDAPPTTGTTDDAASAATIIVDRLAVRTRTPDPVPPSAAATVPSDATVVMEPRSPANTDSSMTHFGQIIGTPAYMAPEQARADLGAQDERTDVYALGVILWEAVVGGRLRQGTVDAVLASARLAAIPDISSAERGRRLEPELARICRRALEPEPSARYPDALALAGDLTAWLDGDRRWRLVQDLDFSALPDCEGLPDGLTVVSGRWSVRSGRLEHRQAREGIVLLETPFPGDVRVEIIGSVLAGRLGELSVVLASRGPRFDLDGYCCQYGAHSGASARIIRQSRDMAVVPGAVPTPGDEHRVLAEKLGPWLRLEVDGRDIIRQRDFFPLSGSHVGVYAYNDTIRIKRIRVWSAGVSREVSCLAVPDALAATGDWANAAVEYRRIRESHPGSEEADEAVFKSGLCAIELDRTDEALAAFDALSDSPMAPLAFVGQSALWERAQDLDREAAALIAGLQDTFASHECARDLVLRAMVRCEDYMMEGEAETAHRVLCEFLARDGEPLRPAALMANAKLLHWLGRYDESLAVFEHLAQEHAERRREARFEAAIMLGRDLQRYDQSIAIYRSLVEEYRDQADLALTARIGIPSSLGWAGRFDEAFSAFTPLLADRTLSAHDRAEALNAMGICLAAAGEHRRAEAVLRQSLEEFPTGLASTAARMELSYLARGRGDLDAALTELSPVMLGDMGWYQPLAVAWSGLYALALGRTADARSCWQTPFLRNSESFHQQSVRFVLCLRGCPGDWEIDRRRRAATPADTMRRTSHRQRMVLRTLIAFRALYDPSWREYTSL
ncbi:MAG: protein kinase [Planctomycetes bacterium]|nr:protein kinase [Planctomycetota bacterium]